MNSDIKYSVVIPTYNRAASLCRAVHSVINQSVPPEEYEIIVVDDGSNDNTKKVVYQIQNGHKNHNLVYLFQENKKQAAAKNMGTKNAGGEIIFFTDDDCIVPKNWIEMLAKGYKKYPGIAGVGGWIKPPEWKNRFFTRAAYGAKILLSNFSYATQEKILDSPSEPTALVPNVSYKKNVLLATGGLNEHISLIGGDELKHRIMSVHKKKLLSMPVTVMHDSSPATWQVIKRMFLRGRQLQQYCNNVSKQNVISPFGTPTVFLPEKIKFVRSLLASRKLKTTERFEIGIYLIITFFLHELGGWFEKLSRPFAK